MPATARRPSVTRASSRATSSPRIAAPGSCRITFAGWDHHTNIYAKTGNSLYTQMKQFDPGFGALLADLSIMPGVDAGKDHAR